MVESFEDGLRRGGAPALRAAGRFLVGDDSVHRSLIRITGELERLRVPYAVVGGMALVAHGYLRTTADVDVLIPAEELARVHAALDGHGYALPYAGSRDLRDAETGVRIEFVLAGEFPGDGRPKPVAFPHPEDVAVVVDGMRFVALETLVELKLASGATAPGRLRDLADVQELVRALALDAAFAERLDPCLRASYHELRAGVVGGSTGPPDDPPPSGPGAA